ncbi:nuclear transport factor 2 family protein [Echinicola vietnamensis]|nr:nuclear transport factor 2 family protein [Echinicola vietnamensis]
MTTKKMTPKDLIEAWVKAFNEGNAAKLSDFYHDDAVNHQVANEPIEGKSAIFEMFSDEFRQAEMTCIVEQILEDGEWGILEWKDPLGLRGCGFFHVVDGKIKFQRGYWDRLSFLRMHNLPIPKE